MKKTVILIFSTLVLLALAACASTPTSTASNETGKSEESLTSQEPIQDIMINATDFSYTTPDSISEGWVRVTLTNSGAEPHHVQFLRLNDGVSFAKFQDAIQQGEGPALALVKQMGGVGAVATDGSAQAILNLPAGEYVILCFIPSPSDHIPHLAKGMINNLKVETAKNSTASEPISDLTVHMQDFHYDLPSSLPTGLQTIKVINDGPEPHELNFLRLSEGKTVQDVMQYLNAPEGPPPFTPVGGMNGLDAGATGFLEFDFQPGTYVAICNIPSPQNEGHPHFTLGMIQEITVINSANTGFPTGKFIKSGTTDYGLLFNADGTFSVFQGNNTYVQGTYTVEGDVLTETSNDGNCKTNISFNYAFDGKNLTIRYLSNPEDDTACTGRYADFNNVTYTIAN